MKSIFSTQNRQTFLRRKNCFLPPARALSPPVGRCEAAIGRPPLVSAIYISFLTFPVSSRQLQRLRQGPEQLPKRLRQELRRRLPPVRRQLPQHRQPVPV